jgi:adenylate cyclase
MAMILEPIADQHGVEQIKLSGCNFTFTSGVLSETENSLERSLRCALAMQDASASFSSGWKLRIGVAFGSVIAGVVGNTRSAFDVWGNPVIHARRLISYTQPGAVSATKAAWEPVKDKTRSRFHGKAMFEGGKEQLDVYTILSI